MATFAPIVLQDGQATPANHTFALGYRRDNEMGWTDRSAGVLAGFRTVSLQTRPATANNAGTRVSVKVKDPRLANVGVASNGVSPVAAKAYETIAELSFMLPAGSDLQARKDIYAYLFSLLYNDQIRDAIVELAPPV
jgi:hypothetical protein